MEHTRGPWRVNLHQGTCHLGVGIEAESDVVVSVSCADCQGDEPRLTEVNARFIVQACNAHEDLLAALQVLVLTPHILPYLEANDPMALEQARAAIAKAKQS